MKPVVLLTRASSIALCLLAASSCTLNPHRNLPPSTHTSQASEMEAQLQEIHRLQDLVEHSLALRARGIKFYQTHVAREKEFGSHIPLTHSELERLYDGAKRYLEIRDAIKNIGLKHSDLAYPYFHVTFTRQGEILSQFDTVSGPTSAFLRAPLTIDIDSPDGSLQMLQLKTSLAAALVLYDNYLTAIYPFTKNRNFSDLFNLDFKAYLTGQANKYTDKNLAEKLRYKIASFATDTGKLDELTDSYLKGQYRREIVAAIAIVTHYEQAVKKGPKRWISPEESYLDALREQSFTYQFILKNGSFGAGFQPYLNTLSKIKGNLLFLSRAFSFVLSQGFGNGIGLIAYREGKLKHLPETQKHSIAERLQPLDLLLERTPFRLTDAFIPGHFGHVAIWIGNYSNLEKLGLDSNPAVKRYANALKKGGSIVEALRSGVQINSLEHFLNIDDLVVLRPRALTTEQRQEYLLQTLKQVGKAYDFDFNIETDHAIVCSELPYIVFKDIDWPTVKSMGRFTIIPDQIAEKALDGTFDLILLYHDGREESGDIRQKLAELIKNPAKPKQAPEHNADAR